MWRNVEERRNELFNYSSFCNDNVPLWYEVVREKKSLTL